MSGTRSEIEARARFDGIRYAQVWEDADVLVSALRIGPGDTVISIASAGDNALALLAQRPARVIAVDLSPAQLACVRLRMGAYRRLSHAEMLELIGSRPSDRRDALLTRVAGTLGAEDQVFWAERRDEIVRHGLGGIGRFEGYFRLFRTRVLPLVHSRATVHALLQPRTRDERERFFERRWNSLRWRLLVETFFSRTVMGRLGRDPAFFDHAEGHAARQVAGNTRHALVDQDPSRNPYLAWILTGRHGDALPLALREENFDVIRDNLDRLELRCGAFESLAENGVRADAFNLSDVFEYMSPQAHADAYASLLACAKPSARIAYWNMMAPRRAPDALRSRVRTDRPLERVLKAQDKAFFYRDFVIETVA
jgi:S-adenosylmethionine-diacylglycerol 3-amino-3-carboxypropyl transferase